MSDDAVTPMMAQYLEIKAAHADALLFYRMGDFYEMFFDDAVVASAALNIALTARGQHLGAAIPMCGVPVVSADATLLTLVRKGHRVAIAEQMEAPAEARRRGAKSVVRRAVVRLVTAGTLTEDALLDPQSASYLAAFAEVRGDAAIAWADISTGEFRVTSSSRAGLATDLARVAPREVLLCEPEASLARIVAEHGAAMTPLARGSFDSQAAERRLSALFGVGTTEGFGAFARAELAALGALADYLDLTQRGRLPLLRPPVREMADAVLQIDAATRRNLEITAALSGGREGSLLAAVDRTVTSAGARLLECRLAAPIRDLATIRARLAAVRHLLADPAVRTALRTALAKVPDIDRALSRLALDRGGPRDLGAIRSGLSQAGAIARHLDDAHPPLAEARAALGGHDDLVSLLDAALVAQPGVVVRDGGFIAIGFDADLDETRRLRDEGRAVIAGLQADYARMTGIAALKIRHNNVLGYFVDVTATHAQRMLSPPLSDTFRHRQTTAGQVRFTTLELSTLETRILDAANRAQEIEAALFQTLRVQVLAQADAIATTARALAEIDLAAAFADLAALNDWTEPVMDESRAFDIRGGRHPVVEQARMQAGAGAFVANDCALSSGATPAVWLVTGPNMAGKSTFLRQNALIALLAHAGSFVPAASAHIGLVSQIFSRVGAADDLARGRSTFMVEMVETAAILNQADDRALVILDEIGRGTATYDGLSIAWATLEHLHDANRCRALFATHYHEMTALAGKLPGLRNATMTVREWQGDVIFLHEVREGAADRSYGVQVARLAGLPAPVIARAKAVLEALEAGERQGAPRRRAIIDDLPLFRLAPPPPAPPTSEIERRLSDLNPDGLTPMEALRLIYDLRAALDMKR